MTSKVTREHIFSGPDGNFTVIVGLHMIFLHWSWYTMIFHSMFSLHTSINFLSLSFSFGFCPLLLLILHFPAFPADLQMNSMLRSWSIKPSLRSWTMLSMTWPPCRSISVPLCCTSCYLRFLDTFFMFASFSSMCLR